MIRFPAHFKWSLTRLSREGAAGLGLLAICLAFYLSALRPTQGHLEHLNAKVLSLHDRIQNAATSMRRGGDISAEQLVTYYRFFPAPTSAPVWLDKIYKAARGQNIKLEQGDYRAHREKTGKLLHYRITLPARGTYLQLRKFLAAVLTEVPIASLDHISFERVRIGDEIIEAKIQLTLYLGQET